MSTDVQAASNSADEFGYGALYGGACEGQGSGRNDMTYSDSPMIASKPKANDAQQPSATTKTVHSVVHDGVMKGKETPSHTITSVGSVLAKADNTRTPPDTTEKMDRSFGATFSEPMVPKYKWGCSCRICCYYS
jgi:hypothetical protein